jgi:hypothetical protein
MVGAIVLLEVAMFILVFWLRAMVVSVSVHPPKAQGGAVVVKKPEFPSLPRIEATGTHSALLKVPGLSDKLAQIGTLNEEAQVFLKQNDFQSAADLLSRAEDVDPRNPTTLKNLAETYNMLNDPVRAKVYWQRLVDLGPGVGTVYAAAKDNVLLLSNGQIASPLKTPSPLARQIYVNMVEKTPVETRNGDAQFHVRAVLKRRDAQMTNFDQKKLQPYVIFYQQMPDASLVPDLNQRKGSFDDTFLFWDGKSDEPFGVDYIMPIPGTPGPDKAPQGEYYGFVIGIYYDKVLQDVFSEPSDLVTRMPLPQDIE